VTPPAGLQIEIGKPNGFNNTPVDFAQAAIIFESVAQRDAANALSAQALFDLYGKTVLNAGAKIIRASHSPFACTAEQEKSVLEILSLAWSTLSFAIGVILGLVARCTLYWGESASDAKPKDLELGSSQSAQGLRTGGDD